MIDMKDQCFGVEVELTGITRKEARRRMAEYFGTPVQRIGGVYDAWRSRTQKEKCGS